MKSYIEQDYSAETIQAMREWISDCQWNDLEPGEEDELSLYEMLRGIQKHYSGGVEQFLTDNEG